MKKIKLFLFAAGLVTSAVCTTASAETAIIPHPFTIHNAGDGKRQVVYFSTDEPTKHTWQEYEEAEWRPLTNTEWKYLLDDRKINDIAADKFRGWAKLLEEGSDTKVTAAYAVLLPDDWAEMYEFKNGAWRTRETEPQIVFNIGPTFDNNPLEAADKAALQQAGAVFLPCDITAGEGTYAEGQYWTSTKEEVRGIYYAHFSTSSTTSPNPQVTINEGGQIEEERYVLSAIREVTITLDENDDNTDLLNIWKTNGQQVNIQLGRSLVPEMYNTFCLPFDLNAKEVKDVLGTTTKLAKFTSGTLSDDKTTLNIDFEDIDLSDDNTIAIKAGEPYLIQPTNAVANPIFYNRTIEVTAADGENFSPQSAVAYLGIINPHKLDAGDKQYLFLQANNTLTWSKEGDTSTMKGMRGYFYVPDMVDRPAGCPARLSVRPAPQTPTASEVVRGAQCTMHSEKYIYNNRVVIIRNGEMRDIFGNIIK